MTNSAKSESESAAATNTASVASEPNCIDLNSASANELTRLPGIGPARAEAIVALRQRRPFEKPGDVRKVKGIGPATFARMRDQICPMEGEGP